MIHPTHFLTRLLRPVARQLLRAELATLYAEIQRLKRDLREADLLICRHCTGSGEKPGVTLGDLLVVGKATRRVMPLNLRGPTPREIMVG